jgi:hypothetical protein
MHLGSPQFTLVVIIQPKEARGTPIKKLWLLVAPLQTSTQILF